MLQDFIFPKNLIGYLFNLYIWKRHSGFALDVGATQLKRYLEV
ncbi:MAG: hypothetical protein BTN85_0690 [Candidatus Methanohalarchaeum thermophilum]|uniref:Uncharacterized protein n=1 Tax=Methanohalarchaeum thermophilum TaxID=1903181 RepID=A0A1Q6DV21_METT1|nr:MAG: hypothetical protein BTN85_0690 [Candidatus Methanohalarchaeum thermophilum]